MAFTYRRQILSTFILSVLTLGASAQVPSTSALSPATSVSIDSNTLTVTPESKKQNFSLFENYVANLGLEFTIGTGSIGFNASTRLSDMVRVRAGLSFFPHSNVPMTFDLMAYGGDDSDQATQDSRFEKMSALMKQFTGIEVDRKVNMNASPTMSDFRLLVDVYPFNDKRWYLTGGFYWGNSRVGHIENTIQEGPTVMGVVIYNNMYEYFTEERFFDEPLYNGVYLSPDVGLQMKEKFERMGRLGAHVGDFKKGSPMYQQGQTTPYMMQPDENGTIYADMYVNHFKPYLGVGYETSIDREKRWTVEFEAAALYWGKPKILTHEYYIYNEDGTVTYGYVDDPEFAGKIGRQINLAEDVDHIRGKVGTYCSIAKTLHVFPVLNLRLSYKLF